MSIIIKYLAGMIMSKGGKIIAGLGVLLLVGGFYKYWEHSVYVRGVDDTVVKYEKRDRMADQKAQSIIDKKNFEIEQIKKERNDAYIEMVTEYSNEIKLLNDRVASAKRMSVTAKKPAACRNELPTETGNQQADSGSGYGVFEVELESKTANDIREIIRDVGYGEAACAQLVEAVEREFIIK